MTWTFQQDNEWFDADFESMEAAKKWLADSLDEQFYEDNAGSYVSYWNPGPERRAQKFTFAKISTDDNGKITIEDRQESWV